MAAPQASPMMILGRIGAPHGIRGWLRVQSFAEPPEGLFEHQPWRLKFADGRVESFKVLETSGAGTAWRVALEGIVDRTAAQRLTGCLIEVDRGDLPALAAREHYREDLVGFEVVNREGVRLGRLHGFVDAPAGPLMVVVGERERWLPAQPPSLRRVRAEEREIDVDWPAEI